MRITLCIRAVTATLCFTSLSVVASSVVPTGDDGGGRTDKILYVWAQDQAHVAPDFLAVINFDEESSQYGKVIRTVPLPPPGNLGNEPHHCHLNSNRTILGCGGLLSVLKGQNGIFFFDVTNATNPHFLFSTKAVESSITDDFLPIENGGFLITQMGAADGSAPGRVASLTAECITWRTTSVSCRCFRSGHRNRRWTGSTLPRNLGASDLNLMMTSDFIPTEYADAGSPGPFCAAPCVSGTIGRAGLPRQSIWRRPTVVLRWAPWT